MRQKEFYNTIDKKVKKRDKWKIDYVLKKITQKNKTFYKSDLIIPGCLVQLFPENDGVLKGNKYYPSTNDANIEIQN